MLTSLTFGFSKMAQQAIQTIQLLIEKSPGCVISRFCHINWSSDSYDLTPLDNFLWGHLKERVYFNNSWTTYVKDEIRRSIDEIVICASEFCEKSSRLPTC